MPLARERDVLLLTLACAPSEPADTSTHALLPGHNECLPVGEEMSEETCLAVVDEANRYPTVSEDKAESPAETDATRAADPELAWLTDEVKRCTCACCHTTRWGGAGVYFWDLDFGPVWTDSASIWSLSVFAGFTEEYEQTLPTEDIARVQAWVEAEADRRYAE